MSLKKPIHPGSIVREECLAPLGLTVTEGARVLGVSRKALSDVVNERAGISPEMAIRLSRAFGGSPGVWVRLQGARDLAEAEARGAGLKVVAVHRRTLKRAA